MTTSATTEAKPLWLSMEGMIRDLAEQDLNDGNREQVVKTLARGLDDAGYNVSGHAGRMLELRAAVQERVAAGRPLLTDFDAAVSSLTLDDVSDTYVAAAKLAVEVGGAFPLLRGLARRKDIEAIMAQTRLDLLIAEAKSLGGEQAVRYLISAEVDVEVIREALSIDQAEYDRVDALMAAERAEHKRVTGLLKEAAEKPQPDQIKHLIDHDAADDLIMEIAGVDQSAIDDVKKAMEAELAEKKRLEEEAAAAKAAAAAGPSLDNIPDDEMLEYIEGIREIMEFSEDPDEIRTMCEQSDIPKCLVDIAVEDASKLDELETKAGG